MIFATSAAVFVSGATLGWLVRALMATLPKTLGVPYWARKIEQRLFIFILHIYSRYTGWPRQSKVVYSGHMYQSNDSLDNRDPTKPWPMNNYLQLLPWTAKYHQSNGTVLEGECATRALIDIIWDMCKDHSGFVSVDYQVDGEPHSTYRIALTQDICFNGQKNSWPFCHIDGYKANVNDSDGEDNYVCNEPESAEEQSKRPALVQAIFTANPNSSVESEFDVTQFFVALDGPMNTFGDMKDIPISQLLQETRILDEEISGGVIKLATVRGAVTLPVETLMREAHHRLCVAGE